METNNPYKSLSRRQERNLLNAAAAAARSEFESPERTGCPGSAALSLLASRRCSLAESADLIDHIGTCSPCFAEYSRYRAAHKRRVGVFSALACAAAVVLYFGVSQALNGPGDEPPSSKELARSPEAPEYEPPPPDAGRGAQVVAIAMQYLGVPYRWGGASPETGFDCSGLTMYVYAQIGVSLPHYAAAQYRLGSPVSKGQLAPGDLVFFRALGHMGMYIGGDNFIHAPRTGDVVKISSLSEPYYVSTWVGARRIL